VLKGAEQLNHNFCFADTRQRLGRRYVLGVQLFNALLKVLRDTSGQSGAEDC